MAEEAVTQVDEPVSPTGEVVSPAVAEPEVSPEGPAPSDEEDVQEIADLQAAIDKAEDPDEKAAHKAKLNTAFAKMRREKREAEKERLEALKDAAYQRGLAEARKREAEAPKAPVPEEPAYVIPAFDKPAPKKEDFDFDDEKYAEARESWLIEKAGHDAFHKAKAEIAAENRKRDAETKQSESSRWAEKGMEKYPDFVEVISTHAQVIPPVMAEAVKTAENSHDIAYFLGKNPKEFSRISGLSPVKQAIEIGKLDAKLAEKPTKPTTSKAPAPITPVKGGVAPAPKSPEEMSMAEYEAHRNKQLYGPDWKPSG